MSILIATPSYNGDVGIPFTQSLMASYTDCISQGVPLGAIYHSGCAIIEYARNTLVHRFLKGNAEALLFIDADLGWARDAVMKLYNSGFDVVGGAYPKKMESATEYPVELFEAEENGCIEAKYLPTGFMMIRRHVFERLIAEGGIQTYIDPSQKSRVHAFFECVTEGGGFVGEDVKFCNRWQNIGGKVWCMPDIDFEHFGTRGWRGNYQQFLTQS